jgi:hypothetical protein
LSGKVLWLKAILNATECEYGFQPNARARSIASLGRCPRLRCWEAFGQRVTCLSLWFLLVLILFQRDLLVAWNALLSRQDFVSLFLFMATQVASLFTIVSYAPATNDKDDGLSDILVVRLLLLPFYLVGDS